MTGETLSWYELASHLRMSLQRCQEETTSTQFLTWMVYLENDVNAFHREDFFLANIAAEIRRVNAKDEKKVNLDSYLIKFTTKSDVGKKKATLKERIKASKRWWKTFTGLNRK